MPTNELEQLMQSVAGGLATQIGSLDVPASLRGSSATQNDPEEPRGVAYSDAGRLAAETEQLRRAVLQLSTETRPAPVNTGTKQDDDSGSTATTVVKTIGLMTGVGPIAAGLMALFGGGSEERPVVSMPFELPSSVSMNAGLAPNRQLTDVMYGADGAPRAVSSETRGKATERFMPPIQINVSAMDSRSFLDHSDDIARAVREAMLHSHSLNDVVSEL